MNLKITTLVLLSPSFALSAMEMNQSMNQSMNHNHHEHSKMMDMEHEMPQIKESKETEESNVIYVCPMHPEIIMNVAGACPICGMNLQKINLDE